MISNYLSEWSPVCVAGQSSIFEEVGGGGGRGRHPPPTSKWESIKTGILWNDENLKGEYTSVYAFPPSLFTDNGDFGNSQVYSQRKKCLSLLDRVCDCIIV